MRARAQVLDYEEGPAAVADEELQTELREINANSRLSQQYLDLARDLDVMEPKLPDEVRHVQDQPNDIIASRAHGWAEQAVHGCHGAHGAH